MLKMNQEFVKELKEGKDLGEMELRTVSGEGVHHAMGTIDSGADWSGTRLETLSQTIVRKMGEQAVLVNYMPFQQQNGKLKIACSSNTHSVAMVSEGEQFGLKDYKLTYKTADLVKFGQQSIITNELLEDSQLAVQNHIVQETSADYARALSDLFLNGNVEGKFEGILNARDAKITTLPKKGAFTANSLKEAYFSLPVEVREAESVGGPLAILDEYYGVYVTTPADAQYRLEWIEEYFTPDMNHEYVYPVVFMDQEDTKRLANLQTDLEKLMNTKKADWIKNGVTDEEWSQYLKDLDAYGLQEYLEIHQKYLDAAYE